MNISEIKKLKIIDKIIDKRIGVTEGAESLHQPQAND
jgi:hypothetical protein